VNTNEHIRRTIHQNSGTLLELSRRIHSTPELGFEEMNSSRWVADLLSAQGFDVKFGVCDLPTAFIATKGSGPLRIGLCAEYDALPDIGHACGHNIIASLSAGAALGAAEAADEVGLTVTVLGTPAEETGDPSGKITMLERGAFEGIHAAMMVHPAPFDVAVPRFIAAATFDVDYFGKEAHASAFPELGINAADAMTIAQTAIGLLRQHIRPTDRIHGIVTHGGEAANIVPAHTSARYMVRSTTIGELRELYPRVHRCFEAGAMGTGARLEVTGGAHPYAEVVHDPELAGIYRRHAESIGRQFMDSPAIIERIAASTDMGNVSLRLPSIHPLIGINSLPAANHQREFTAHCISEHAEKALLDGAVALAWTAVECATNASLRQRLTGTT
jgi:amidohydrolase